MLTRSRQAPLNVSCAGFHCSRAAPGKKQQLLEEILIKNMPRVHQLHVDRELTINQLGPANGLRELHLSGYRGLDVPRAFAGLLFNHEAPMLQALELKECSVTWPQDVLHLYLRTFSVSSSSTTLHDILVALRGMPLLEVLELQNVLPDGIDPSESSHTIILPHIQSIYLTGELRSTVNFLSHFDLNPPSLRSVTLSRRRWCETGADDLEKQIKQITAWPGLKYASTMFSESGLVHEISTQFKKSDTSRKVLRILDRRCSHHVRLQTIGRCFPLSDVEAFTISGRIPPTNLEQMLQQMPRLRAVRFQNYVGFSFLHFLRLDPSETHHDHDSVADAHAPPLRLQVLAFSNIAFSPNSGLMSEIRNGTRPQPKSQVEIMRIH